MQPTIYICLRCIKQTAVKKRSPVQKTQVLLAIKAVFADAIFRIKLMIKKAVTVISIYFQLDEQACWDSKLPNVLLQNYSGWPCGN